MLNKQREPQKVGVDCRKFGESKDRVSFSQLLVILWTPAEQFAVYYPILVVPCVYLIDGAGQCVAAIVDKNKIRELVESSTTKLVVQLLHLQQLLVVQQLPIRLEFQTLLHLNPLRPRLNGKVRFKRLDLRFLEIQDLS
eukprot:sb/3474345/